MIRKLVLFMGVFVLATFIQAARMHDVPLIDMGVWYLQPQYVLEGNPEEFNVAKGYGHPGGPIIEGTIAVHALTGLSWENALLVLLSALDGLFIAGIVVLCYVLRRDIWWSVAAFSILSLHGSLAAATPPSALIAYVLTFLCLLTLYLYERRDAGMMPHVLWSVVAGFAVATRFDIGGIATAAFAALLLMRIQLKRMASLLFGSFIVFCILDPFMWFMPLRHVQDLLFKLFYHYVEFPTPTHLSPLLVAEFSVFALLSMVFAVLSFTVRRHVTPVLPERFTVLLLAFTIGLYAIFMTAVYEAERYFLPLLFIWETFLPLFIFHLIAHVRFSFVHTERGQRLAQNIFKGLVILLLAAYPILFIVRFNIINP